MYGLPKNVCCVCDPSIHLDVPSIGFVCVGCACRKLSPHFGVCELDHRCLLSSVMLFLCVILHTMWSGESLLLLCILPFPILCLQPSECL